MNLKKIINRYPKLIRNKFFWATMIFLVWITFFDEHNVIHVWHNSRKLAQEEEDINYYRQKVKNDQAKLKELKTNKANLEKFAREQYLMKKQDEDIYLVVKDDSGKEK